jgi:hypothetical protein
MAANSMSAPTKTSSKEAVNVNKNQVTNKPPPKKKPRTVLHKGHDLGVGAALAATACLCLRTGHAIHDDGCCTQQLSGRIPLVGGGPIVGRVLYIPKLCSSSVRVCVCVCVCDCVLIFKLNGRILNQNFLTSREPAVQSVT